jgi:hypothetical protein
MPAAVLVGQAGCPYAAPPVPVVPAVPPLVPAVPPLVPAVLPVVPAVLPVVPAVLPVVPAVPVMLGGLLELQPAAINTSATAPRVCTFKPIRFVI